MAQYKFPITIEAETPEAAQEFASYLQGVINKANNKKMLKILKGAYKDPKKIDKAAMFI